MKGFWLFIRQSTLGNRHWLRETPLTWHETGLSSRHMKCHWHAERETSRFCPDCGEPACDDCLGPDGRCAACGSPQSPSVDARTAGPQTPAPERRRFKELSTLAKAVALFTLIIGVIAGVPWGMDSVPGFCQTVLGWLGVAAAVLMMRVHPVGWWLGLVWAIAQVVEIIVENEPLNRQVLFLGGSTTTNGVGLGLNMVGIILVVLYLCVRKQFIREASF
jgi:hypothetical protein